ncbi:restriction endonuclease subunit S [Avibacterium gallinarum]|uniref:Protein HsdA n=2 Tax=Avibacterium gallinarum TaxID=755 RepID=A0A379AWG1_AVIGA|nr:restriction endonuclease subunit S [Avibacterium gallinarum]TDP30146.1 type I restriction enzyme S subunit [Avibacterium gallinarum]SUB26646.1 protein HsdA [Avibacterium gallinarum]
MAILKELAYIQSGYAYKAKDFLSTGKFPVLKIKNIRNGYIDYSDCNFINIDLANKTKKWETKENDILISMTGSGPNAPSSLVGRVARVRKGEEKAYINQRIGRIIVTGDIDPDFIFYFLSQKSVQKYLVDNSTGSANQVNISAETILSIELPKVTYEDSVRIKNILNKLDEKITLNTQTNQTLEQIAQGIFKHWFIDFAPVHAKANALARGETAEQAELAAMACLSGKTVEKITALKTQDPTAYHQLQQTAAAFPSEFVETEMGEVPRGWEVKQVKDMGKIICGKTPSKKKEEFYGNDIPFIKIPDMHNNTFIIKTTDNLSLLGANNQKTKFIEKGSICISCIATVGLVSITSERSQTNQQINSIVPNSEIFTEYLYLYFSQDTMNKKLKDLASGGSATLNLNTTAFSNITLLIPNNNLIEFFHKKVQPLFDKILSNKKESISLSDTRDELLPKLLSGDIEL